MTGLLYCLPLTSNWLQTDDPKSQSTLQDCISALNENKQPLILFGDDCCGKTALSFQAGVAYANQDYHVTVISRHPLSRLPLSIHGMIRPDAAGRLNTLTFMYMAKVADLLEFCTSMHTKTILPDVLIIDDLDFYLGQLTEPSPEIGCAKLCTIIADTIAFLSSKSPQGVLIAACKNRSKQCRQIFSQFKFTIADISVMEKEEKQYELKVTTDKVDLTVSYNIQDTTLYLQDLEASCVKT